MVGSPGCTRGPHVFSHRAFTELARHNRFRHTADILQLFSQQFSDSNEKHQLIALDAEMCYTTAGMEVTRLSAVGADGRVLLDAYAATDGCIGI